MNPAKVDRNRLRNLTDLPNIGPATAADLRLLGIETPGQLAGQCPFELYRQLCRKTGMRHDPCTLDVFMAAIRFLDGEPARAWWVYSGLRKQAMAGAARSSMDQSGAGASERYFPGHAPVHLRNAR